MLLDYSDVYETTDTIPVAGSAYNEPKVNLYSKASASDQRFYAVGNKNRRYAQYNTATFNYARVIASIRSSQIADAFAYQGKKWLEETMWSSSTTAMRRAHSYCDLVSLGRQIGPLALKALATGDVRVQWLVLLRDIYGTSPVPNEEKGKPKLMAQRWLDWGRETGKLK